MKRFYLCLFCISVLLLNACVSRNSEVLKVSDINDVPNIRNIYATPLEQLKVGMTLGQVTAIFPNAERECYPSGQCHITIFDQRLIQFDSRIDGINALTGGLFSLLALTCILADDSCYKAMTAAVNVGIASAIEHQRIQNSDENAQVIAFAQLINSGTFRTTLGATTQPAYRSHPPKSGIITLLQWINIEVNDGKVTHWVINEPLERFKPKSFKNELPALEDAMNTK